MISVETFRKRCEPVEALPFSTAWTHGSNRADKPSDAVFPVIHTPYGYYERI